MHAPITSRGGGENSTWGALRPVCKRRSSWTRMDGAVQCRRSPGMFSDVARKRRTRRTRKPRRPRSTVHSGGHSAEGAAKGAPDAGAPSGNKPPVSPGKCSTDDSGPADSGPPNLFFTLPPKHLATTSAAGSSCNANVASTANVTAMLTCCSAGQTGMSIKSGRREEEKSGRREQTLAVAGEESSEGWGDDDDDDDRHHDHHHLSWGRRTACSPSTIQSGPPLERA